MTNFERITASPEMLAMVLAEFAHIIYEDCANKLAEKGIDCSLIELDDEIQVQIHKEWLESETDHLIPIS